MIKEKIQEVEKVWGKEVIICNNDQYCGKLLVVNRGAKGSYHYHSKKKETFYCIEGFVILTVEGKEYILTTFTRPKTILPGERHCIYGQEPSVLIEISTPHSDEDVTRIHESIADCSHT